MLLWIIGIVTILASAIYYWATAHWNYFKQINLPAMKPRFFMGNTGGFFMKQYRANEFVQGLYQSHPNEKIFGLFDFQKPMFMIRDPDMIKKVTVKDFDYFENHRSIMDESIDNILTKGLISLRGNKWRHMRATLSPAFTGSKMRQMFELVSECADDMSTVLRRKIAENDGALSLEMKDLFSKYTNDVIASAAFGIRVNSFENENNEFLVNGNKILNAVGFKTVLKFMLAGFFPRLMEALKVDLFGDVSDFFKTMVMDTMAVRQRENIFRPDMINLLMPLKHVNTASDKQVNQVKGAVPESVGFATADDTLATPTAESAKVKWTDNEIVAQCFLFFAAGFDTTSSAISFLIYELAINPGIQEKLYQECVATQKSLTANSDQPESLYNVLQKMKYMDQAVSEVLRMWPPAMFTDRQCGKDYVYDDGTVQVNIKKDQIVWLPIYGLHHDEKYFPNPEKFQPERFSDENKANIVPGTYIPFGSGPRSCIASRFALMEVKAIVYHIILNFRVEPNEKTQIPLMLQKSPTPHTEHGIHIQLKLRE